MSSSPNLPDHRSGLCVSIVLYRSDRIKLRKTLHHLFRAIEHAHAEGEIARSKVVLVDNDPPSVPPFSLTKLIRECDADNRDEPYEVEVIRTGKNLGFGSAHNLAIQSHSFPFHLILNPDVYIPLEGISLASRYCREHPDVVLLGPAVYSPDGERQYLLRPVPNLCDIFLRFAAMTFPSIRKWRRYCRYECRHLDPHREHHRMAGMSGCFMWCRTEALQRIGGFDPRFFLYYEDYDLSRRLAQIGRTVYYPLLEVTHDWERLILSNRRLRYYNLRSAIRYFNKWGWKWI